MYIEVERGSFRVFLLLLKPTSPGVWRTSDLVRWPLKMRDCPEVLSNIGCSNLVLVGSALLLLSCLPPPP